MKVAILTDSTFDALQVDPTTVVFGPNAASSRRSQIRDVDRDGDADLLLTFKVRDTGISCEDVGAAVSGETYSGDTIIGSDSFTTEGC